MKTGNAIAAAGVLIALAVLTLGAMDDREAQGRELGTISARMASMEDKIDWIMGAMVKALTDKQLASLEKSDGD